MEGDGCIRERACEADDLEVLGRVFRRRECRCDDETEAAIVAMISDQDAPLGTLFAQRLKPCLDQLAAHTAALKARFYRYRTEDEPAALLRWAHLREGEMPNDLFAQHADKRQGECIGLAQRIDDERFRSVTEGKP